MTKELSSAQAQTAREPRLQKASFRIYRALIAAWKFIAGVALTQSFFGSILVVGWTWRAAQRAVRIAWWKQSVSKESCFCDFARNSTYQRDLGSWPNWVLAQDAAWPRGREQAGTREIRALPRAVIHSLWLNLRIGLQGIFNTWVLTLPGCALMLFSWYAGWHNSFNKGYEQAPVGPLTGFAGIALFIAAMYYVPMAQMRQASTGNWRAFYEFKTVWKLVRKKWFACFALAMTFAALSVPVTILKTAPGFFPQINPRLAALSPSQALEFAQSYYFYSGFAVFAAFVALRMIAARIYATALLACIQSGSVTEDVLAENEWETLHRLDLLAVRPAAPRHFLVRTVAWLGTRVGRVTTGVALFFVWFLFTGQIYISEFLVKSPWGRGWLNQPLVQLPWFNYIPPGLKAQAEHSGDETEPSISGAKASAEQLLLDRHQHE